MTKKRLKLVSLFLLCLGLTGIQAQEIHYAIPASGGNASGSGGTASYTVGQVVYTTHTSTTGSVAEGVQQPFEISVVTGLEEAISIHLTMTIYPNPATDLLTLNIGDYQQENMYFILFDMTGKLLQQQEILQQESHINIGFFATGTYFLKIICNSKEIKTFKIIKNQ